MSGFTSGQLLGILHRICKKLENSKSHLNDLDAQLGDGDLGSTLSQISSTLGPKLNKFPNDVGEIFEEVAKVIGATSGSSFCAITMFGLIKLSIATAGAHTVDWEDLPDLLDEAIGEMSRRGRAKLGDKTVLDGLAFISKELRNCSDSEKYSKVAKSAILEALNQFRDEPSNAGRARLASERSKGADDPGMYALYLAVEAI